MTIRTNAPKQLDNPPSDLLGDPRTLIIDESVNGLDPEGRRER